MRRYANNTPSINVMTEGCNVKQIVKEWHMGCMLLLYSINTMRTDQNSHFFF